MATALRQPYQQYRQRTLITGIAAALVLVIVVFLAHDFYRRIPGAPVSDSATAAPTP
jgi:hypothetical protein